MQALPDKKSIETQVQSAYLTELLESVPDISDALEAFLSNINHTAAAEGNKMNLFGDTDKFPDVKECKEVPLIITFYVFVVILFPFYVVANKSNQN